jgi:hypothetical protein
MILISLLFIFYIIGIWVFSIFSFTVFDESFPSWSCIIKVILAMIIGILWIPIMVFIFLNFIIFGSKK